MQHTIFFTHFMTITIKGIIIYINFMACIGAFSSNNLMDCLSMELGSNIMNYEREIVSGNVIQLLFEIINKIG